MASIREAHVDDAPVLLALAIELGYANDLTEIRERIVFLRKQADHTVLVAEHDGRVCAFMQLRASHQLESASYAEIAGLIVADKLRASGIGTQLVAAAESWARRRGLRDLRVRTNAKRLRTQGFYRKVGFEELKDQKSFIKRLGSV
jgi:N-acetylglutamate synthase-like GNAT family acetyltransferase